VDDINRLIRLHAVIVCPPLA